MKKRNLLLAGLILTGTIKAEAAVPETIGAIMGKEAALYSNHDGGEAIDPATLKATTLDYKVVTIDGTSYVYVKASNNVVPYDGWGLQYRYWSEAMAKTENNILDKTDTYAIQTVTEAMPDPLKYISFFANVDGFCETDYITYNPAGFNNTDETDRTAPAITSVKAEPSVVNAAITIESDDPDAFYYIEDTANDYRTVAILSGTSTLTGLKGGTSYNLSVTPIDFNGNKGIAHSISFTTKEELAEVRVPASTTTYNMAEGWGTFEDVTDPVHGQVLHALAETGQAWVMVQANQPLPEGLGELGQEFSYAHVIAKCPKDGQVVRGGFTTGEVAMTNPFIPANEWQDIVFAFEKSKITGVVVYMDYYGDGQPTDLPKEIWLKEVVFNNDPTPLLEAAEDTEAPILVSATIVEESLTYNSLQVAVSATDNIAVAGYTITDEANSYEQTFTATDGTITVTGLNPGTKYRFTVRATDTSGNLSDAIELDEVTTPVRTSEDQGELVHFDGLSGTGVGYSITSPTDGTVVYTLTASAGKTLNWGQIRLYRDGEFKGFEGMTIADDGQSASYTIDDADSEETIYNMFVWGFEGSDAHYQNTENENLEGYIYYVAPFYVPVSIDRTSDADWSVIPVEGGLQIVTGQALSVTVYGIDGRCAASVAATEGITTIKGLSKGMYIVNNRKVMVK